MWSKNFECCLKCGKTTYKHVAKGVCNSCYLAAYRELHKKRIVKQKRRWYVKNVTFDRLKMQREKLHYAGNRDTVLARDGHKCVQCGAADKLTVHHKDGNGRGSSDPNNDLSNLVTLCRSCHINVHRKELYAYRSGELVKLAKERKPPYKQQPIITWARHYAACVICGKTDSRHTSNGRCSRCVQHANYVSQTTLKI